MDDELSFVVEMNQAVWGRFVADLDEVTPEEADLSRVLTSPGRRLAGGGRNAPARAARR
jgi:hypothetical protein